MGWFSPIKGDYPSLGQIDKTLPVDTDESNKAIERGMIIEMAADAVNADGAFKIATSSSNEGLLYVSLQDYDDAQAGMAGTTGFDGNVPSITEGNINIPGVTAGVPAVTGLSLSMDGEYETDQFVGLEGAAVGTKLWVDNGRIVKANGDNFFGYLTGAPYSRWVNNAVAKPENGTKRTATRQGKNVTVIRFRTK